MDLFCALRNKDYNAARRLIQDGAVDVDWKNQLGDTLLHIAADKGQSSIVKLLLQKGFDVNRGNDAGDTPLFFAVGSGSLECVQVLLEHSANIRCQNIAGKSVLHLPSIPRMIRFLLEKDPSLLKLKDGDDNTPLHAAVLNSERKLVDVFLEEAEKQEYQLVNAVNVKGDSALHLAVRSDQKEIVHALRRSFAKLDLENKDGKTPLDTTTNEDIKGLLNPMPRQYEIRRSLICGPFSQVSEVEGKNSGKLFAAKSVLRFDFFMREVTALKTLKHPNVVSIVDWWCLTKDSTIVLELCNEDLRSWLMRIEYRSHNHDRRIFRDVAAAVEFIHGRDLVHLNIKPTNILVNSVPELSAKISDFSTAVAISRGSEHPLLRNLGQDDPRSYDISSLAMVWFELLFYIEDHWTKMDYFFELSQGRVPSLFQRCRFSDEEDMILRMAGSPENRPTASEVVYLAEKMIHVIEWVAFGPRRETPSTYDGPSGRRYVDIGLLGNGGYAEVFKVEVVENSEKHRYALKRLMRSEQNNQVIQREIDAMTNLQHENVVKLVENWMLDGRLIIVMELCGGTLFSWLDDSRDRPAKLTTRVFEGICAGLVHIHSKGYIHRDLHPRNILLNWPNSFDGFPTVKIADLGLSVKVDGLLRTAGIGCKMYSAPEVRPETYPEETRRIPYDNKADIFSIGLIWMELLVDIRDCGHRKLCFEVIKEPEFIESGGTIVPKDPGNVFRKLKGAVAQSPTEMAMIAKMLNPDPAKRPTAAEVHELAKQIKDEMTDRE
ncbi:unnamed protein product [Cyprideis torosa]|uniref:Uncharacterized protein n=1 Tax=Cyprideis torosa TaxID=163714 RepID=A0A7R8WR93_9CRUS|nr:unnamed protein product [Cyprideis torosa]CAG0903898.1 unnamed protein product [Cyprideis torosa]